MKTNPGKWRLGLFCLAMALVLAAAPAAEEPAVTGTPGQAPDLDLPALDEAGRLETILARFDAAQASIRTLEADFQEVKELALLAEAVEGNGRFYFATPHQAKWEYLQPEARVFLISDNSLVQYFPTEKVLERRDLRAANTNRLFKLFGMGQSSKDLEDFYVISLGENAEVTAAATDGDAAAGAAPPADTYELILTPRRRAVEKRVARVRIWVGDQSFLPRAMKLEEADGDFTFWVFSNVRINDELAAGVFDLDVPGDVTVQKGVSLFQSSEGSAP